MTETAPHYIADTRFAAKLQELVNEHGINSLLGAEQHEKFRAGLDYTYMKHKFEWTVDTYKDLLVTAGPDEVEGFDGKGDFFATVFGAPSKELSEKIFADFEGFWDTGNIDEVIPASRSFQRAKRECKATRLGI